MKATGKILPTFGVDALPEALVKIEAGEMAGTVLNDAKGQASATFNMVVNLAAGKEPTEGTDLKLDNKIEHSEADKILRDLNYNEALLYSKIEE